MTLRSNISYKEKFLGGTLTCDHLTITGCKLPTNKQVLQSMLAHIKCNDLTPLLAAKNVVEKVSWYYRKGGIPTIFENKMVEEVQKLKKKLDGIVKLPVKHRNEPPAAVTKFREDLDKTFKGLA